MGHGDGHDDRFQLIVNLLSQIFPSPVNPALHSHSYEPYVLLHTANVLWQVCRFNSHSSMSGTTNQSFKPANQK